MIKKKLKQDFNVEEVNLQLKKLINEHDIVNMQKCYLYTNLKTWKELYENLELKYRELESENIMLYNKLNTNKEENKENESNGNLDLDDSFNIKTLVDNYNLREEELTPSKLKSQILEKDKKIVELENTIIKLQILSRHKKYKTETEEDVDENELLNLKTKVEYSIIEKERLIINSNNKIMEEKIKFEEFMKKYNDVNEKYHNSLIDIENLKNNIKDREIHIKEQIDKVNYYNYNFWNELDNMYRNIYALSNHFESIKSLFVETNKLNDKLINKLKNFKLYENKKSTKSGEEFYEEEISNLLEVCDNLSSDNIKLQDITNTLEKKCNFLLLDNTKLKNDSELISTKNSSCTIVKYVEDLSKQKQIISELTQEIKSLVNEKNKLVRLNVDRIKLSDQYKDELKIKNIQNVCLEKKNEDIEKMVKELKNDIYNRLSNSTKVSQNSLICNLCDINLKNIAIVSCMHTFCEGCVNMRIKLRDRKCPTCGLSFNVSDVKKIYF